MRSGVVRWNALSFVFTGSLSHPAPIPPLALLAGQPWVAGLGNRSRKDIKAADVLALAGQAAQFLIEIPGILGRELINSINSKDLEIPSHRGPDRNEVSKASFFKHRVLLQR